MAAQPPLHRNLWRDRLNDRSRSKRIWGSRKRVSGGRQLGEQEIPFPNNARMIGVIDMVSAIQSGPRASWQRCMAYHVLEVMCAFDKSSETGEHVVIESTTERPEPVPVGLK